MIDMSHDFDVLAERADDMARWAAHVSSFLSASKALLSTARNDRRSAPRRSDIRRPRRFRRTREVARSYRAADALTTRS
jgi:hypothetical protein